MGQRILITGITGQDGPYMAELCLGMGHTVYGMARRTAQIHDTNFRHLKDHPQFHIVRGDLLDASSINNLVRTIRPDYFINFAAQSFVGDSWKIPEETFIVTAVGVLRCLEAIHNNHPSCRFYNAGSSEQFGDVIFSPQDEGHPFRPRSPYGAAKCAAMHLVKVYRESYQLYAIQGMLFNHESERRGEEFVTRKITKGLARIVDAMRNCQTFAPIHLGNLDAKRDWSHANDFMDAIWRMLNQEKFNNALLAKVSGYPHYMTKEDRQGAERHLSIREDVRCLSQHIKEYVVASGQTHTIREFIDVCVQHLQTILNFPACHWHGDGIDEKLSISSGTNPDLVVVDAAFYRPADVNLLLGNPSAIVKELGWAPKISFDTLAKRMIEYDLYDAGIMPQINHGDSQKETVASTSGPQQTP